MGFEHLKSVLEGIGIAVRAVSGAVGLLLIARSVVKSMVPASLHAGFRLFFRYTDSLVGPVQRILPASIRDSRVDYAPLVTAILVLFIGLGIHAFFEIAVNEFIGSG